MKSGLVEIGNLCDGRIVPEVFEIVILSRFGQENVRHHIAEVYCDPLGVGAACDGSRMFAHAHTRHVFDAVDNAVGLCRRTGGADHKGIGRCRGDVAQIGHDNVAAFFVLDSFDDDVYEVFGHWMMNDVKR